MRIFLVIIVLSLLFSNKGFAEPRCNELIEFEWYWTDNFGTKVNEFEAKKAKMVFKNIGNKEIIITEIFLKTKNKDIVVKAANETYLQPYGKTETSIGGLNYYNLDVVGLGGYECMFGSKPEEKFIPLPLEEKSGAQKWLDKIRGN